MGDGDDHSRLESFYRRYNQRCNDHQFDQLADFVAADVEVNGDAARIVEVWVTADNLDLLRQLS